MELVEGETLAQILARIKGAEPETDTPLGVLVHRVLVDSDESAGSYPSRHYVQGVASSRHAEPRESPRSEL